MTQYNTSASLYFTLAFTWSFVFWFLTTRLGGLNELPGSLIFYVAGAGPFLVALALVHLRESKAEQKSLWVRTFDPRLMSEFWLLVALLIHPLLVAIAGAVDIALGGEFQTRNVPSEAWPWLTMAVAVFVLGPLPEEMAWRGVALDRLQNKFSPLLASILLGSAWALWHVPLFFIEDGFHHQLGFASPRFWIFLATMVPLSIIMTWVYNHTNRSVLSAVLIHFTGNMCGALIHKTDQMAALELLALSIAALLIWARSRDLGYRKLADLS